MVGPERGHARPDPEPPGAQRRLRSPNTGAGSLAPTLITRTLLLHTGEPYLYALDKRSGERLGRIDLPAPGSYGLITYMQDGRQHIVVQVNSAELPNSLVALRLP